ncbi:MAG: hypothetical protein F6K16_29300 [Symploca sp. SIO2B6]|nr:hypothetical protein [Symploca sp. SIO2B6]
MIAATTPFLSFLLSVIGLDELTFDGSRRSLRGRSPPLDIGLNPLKA